MANPNNWLRIAGSLGAVGVGLGAYGAHGVTYSSEKMRETVGIV